MARFIFHNECFGQVSPSRFYYATPPPYSPNVVNQTVDYGGATWKGDPGGGWHLASQDSRDPTYGGGGGGGNVDPVALAKQLVKVQQEANQPAIQTLQGNIAPLQQKYTDLVNSIKGAGTVAANATTLTTANELGKRGLLPSDTYGQQQINAALLPVQSAYAGQAAQTGLAGQQDINNIYNAIAQLQAGNPANAVTAASSYGGYAQSANAAIQAAQIAANTPKVAAAGGFIYDPATGQITSAPNTSTLTVGNQPKTLSQIFGGR